MQLLNAIANRPWLIEPSHLQLIIDVVTGEKRDEELADELRAAREERPAALAMRRGTPLANTNVMVRDGVAHISIVGPITRYATIFSRVSGLASLDAISANVQAALDAPEVRAILLELDTPGGEVTGIAAFGELLYAARGKKPIWAYVDGMAASAGYWIASSTSRVVTDPAGILGSIGAVLALRDPSKGPESTSVKFISAQSPLKQASPITDEGRAQYQRLVDRTAEVFIEAVARNRGVVVDTVLSDFGQGGVFVGQDAVDAGLADQVGTFEETLAALAAQSAAPAPRYGGSSMPANPFRQFFAAAFGGAVDAGVLPKPPVASDGTPEPVAESLLAAAAGQEPAQEPAQGPAGADDVAMRIAAAEERAAAAQREADAVKAELAKLQGNSTAAAIKAFVDGAISAGQALPAEREALTELYTKAVAGGYAAEVERLVKARPAHTLTKEQVPTEAPGALPLERAAAGDKPLTAERRRELLSATVEGRAILAREAAEAKAAAK